VTERREGRPDMDTYGELAFISNHRQEIVECLPAIVKGRNACPNEEFVIDAIRSYENLREVFEEMVKEHVVDPESTKLTDVVETSAKQLSVILLSVMNYPQNERLAHDVKIQDSLSKLRAFLPEILSLLKVLAESADEAPIVHTADLFEFLLQTLTGYARIFEEIESIIQTSVLTFARDLLFASVRRILDFCAELPRTDRVVNSEINSEFARAQSLVCELVDSLQARSARLTSPSAAISRRTAWSTH
jgi:hypothetical protein